MTVEEAKRHNDTVKSDFPIIIDLALVNAWLNTGLITLESEQFRNVYISTWVPATSHVGCHG